MAGTNTPLAQAPHTCCAPYVYDLAAPFRMARAQAVVEANAR